MNPFTRALRVFQSGTCMLHLEKRPLSHSWKTIVAIYASERLPFGKDKLVAISGIARAVQKKTNDDYFTWPVEEGHRISVVLAFMVVDYHNM